MDDTGGVCYWRQLWKLTSSTADYRDSSDLTEAKIERVREQLESGLNYFKSSSPDSFTRLKTKTEKYPKIITLVEKLQKFMNLDSFQTWDIFCHYLSDRFHGTADDVLNNFTFLETQTAELIREIWTFYNSERIFMLQLLKNILVLKYYKNSSNHRSFQNIIDKITLDKLKSSLISQFKNVIEEVPPNKSVNGDNVTFDIQKKWMRRNLNEQADILSLLLLIIEQNSLTILEFKQLFSLFKLHNFGRQPVYYKYLDDSFASSVLKVVYAEVAIFYKMINDSKSVTVSSIIKNVKDDVEGELVRLQHNGEHGAFLLAWMLLLLEDPNNEEMFFTRYQHFGTKALQLRVFEFLYNMSQHPTFSQKSCCGKIFRKSLYQLLSNMCNRFDSDGSMALHVCTIELCNELLRSECVASDFWNCMEGMSPGVISLWNTALEYFPFDFKTLSVFVTGLADTSSDSFVKLMKELNNLPMYTIRYKSRMVTASNVGDLENIIITKDFHPYENNKEFVIKAGTHAVIMDRRNTTLIHFRVNVSYWKIFFYEVQNLIENNLQQNYDVSVEIDNIVWGIRALNMILKKNNSEMLQELVRPCEAVFELFLKFVHSRLPYVSLISSSLDVSTSLVPLFANEIFTRLTNVKLLPYVGNVHLSFEQYANGETFNTSLIGHYLVNIELLNGEYDIFSSYLDIVFAFYECKYNDDIAIGILLPALIFILREVFPHMFGWTYKTNRIKLEIQYKCVSYLFKILNLSPEHTTKPVDSLLNKICLYSLLNVDNGITLLKLVSLGNENIQQLMEQEVNWTNGLGMQYIKIIHMSMSALMQVLRLKHLVHDKTILSPLEHMIYTQPQQKDSMRIVPTVIGYMNHVFHKNLPDVACRLLKRFAMESHISLLVCLDMNPHQIRTMFLERLRDKNESDILKTVILEFVSICIENQPGLTEVFFKVTHDEGESKIFSKETKNECIDGILTYMAEYLATVKNDTSSLYSPLLNRIMGLFHALWKNNMQMLVQDLKKNQKFWEYLCNPLFQDILPNIKAYSQIFNMIAIELYLFEEKIDKSLHDSLEKLFTHKDKHLSKWVDYIFSFDGRQLIGESVDEVPCWLSLLTSWKDFVTIIMKHLPFSISSQNKYMMSTVCLNTLNSELEKMTDNRVITMLAEIYVIYFSNWKEDCVDDRHEFTRQITELLNHTAASFESLHPRAVYSILSICTLTLNLLSYDLKSEKELTVRIFHSVCFIVNVQLEKLCDNDCEKSDQLNSMTMGLKLLTQAVYIFREDLLIDCPFSVMNLINKLVISTMEIIHNSSRQNQTIAALSCLTAFAKYNASKVFLYCNVSENLWLKFLPPKELHCMPSESINWNDWTASSWWKIYQYGIEFVTVVLQKQGNYFSSDAILFAGVQEEYLMESILMVRHTLDMDALNLTSSALYFISELIKHENKWKYEHNSSLLSLMRAISICMHYCITLILRPRGIHLSIESPSKANMVEDGENSGPTPKVVAVLNKLLELMHLSSLCLKSFSPDLLDLLTNPYSEILPWKSLIELQFGAPKLSSDPVPALTFGTVLSAVCFLTRSLNYNYHAEDIPLNIIKRTVGRKGSFRRRISGGDESVRRRSLRSDSVTSVSSTTSTIIAPNWLVALDKKVVLITLETILTLLASQSLLAIKDVRMATRDKQLIRRELCAELPIFHDFVKKKIIDSSHPKNHLSRRKYGIFPMLSDEEESRRLMNASSESMEEEIEQDDSLFTPPPPPRKRISDSMRVSVTRKLYLDKRNSLADMSTKEDQPSTSGSIKSSESTPESQKQSGRSTKHVTWDEYSLSPQDQCHMSDDEEIEHTILSEVQMVEEDYLHFLSNIFMYICQTDN